MILICFYGIKIIGTGEKSNLFIATQVMYRQKQTHSQWGENELHTFSRSKKKNDARLKLNIYGSYIQKLEYTKCLGITLDQNLNWENHINSATKKLSRIAYSMFKARKYIGESVSLTLYNSLAKPILDFYNETWGSTYASRLSKINVLQKYLIRIMRS